MKTEEIKKLIDLKEAIFYIEVTAPCQCKNAYHTSSHFYRKEFKVADINYAGTGAIQIVEV